MEAKNFSALKVSIASPEQIKSWSYGEVLKPETINYRRLRPEKDGLFCEAIFGPSRDWQCYCGKYKNVRYRGVICDKCGVEVTRSSVRRERMGHIELAAPVAHVWYTRRVPSYLGLLLDVSRRNLDRVLYFAQYVVTHLDEEARQKALRRLDEEGARHEQRLNDEINSRITYVHAQRDKRLADLDNKRQQTLAMYDDEVAEKVDPVIKEGQRLERALNDSMGTTVEAPIHFAPTAALIADRGETIDRKHLVVLNKAVQARLDELEAVSRDRRDRTLARIDAEVERIRREADEATIKLHNQFEEQVGSVRDALAADREELQSLHQMMFMGEARYRELKSKWGQVFKANMGAEALYDILKDMNLGKLTEELWGEVRQTRSKARRKKATKRLKVVEALRKNNNRPEWMILKVLPVIPPELRPMVQLDGGRFATSDLNDLYRRVINRNNRLKRLLDLGAPDVIVRNEKRMLQEAVDSLIDNSQRGKALSRRGRRELKSLSDMLKGKKGRFRRNLLGKRVDYSGRSVIVIGPKLKLHQCGLPKTMALELYRPFVISRLVKYNYASNVKGAKRIIERERPEVWEVLEEVIKDRPVLLNRAPTLHRLGIQAFEPVLVEGKAIQIHPLVCSAFNADFDGDQMAVHVPLSDRAVEEARTLMLSTKNLLKPADGEPVVGPQKDMVLGVYYLTMADDGVRGEGRAFYDIDEVEMAYSLGQVDLHAKIKLRVTTWLDDAGERYQQPQVLLMETTVGRALFNHILPPELRFVNQTLDKGAMQRLVSMCYQVMGPDKTTEVVDQIKTIGMKCATISGITIAISDLTVPPEKKEIVDRALDEAARVEHEYRRGLLTQQEQDDRVIELWNAARDEVSNAVAANLDPSGNVSVMAMSGATKGGFTPIAQMAGMKGLVADPAGRIIPLPIRSNFRDGLTALEYFISTHGSRKGLADTALRTADAGYLTRRLVDVAQEMIINAHDCGTEAGIWLRREDNVQDQTVSGRALGRVAARNLVDPETGELIVAQNELIDEEAVQRIGASGIEKVYVRSPLTCAMHHGLCSLCYGRDLGRGKLVEAGAAVGVVAAQSIGEPGTQLTLRTFHTGGVASAGDITSGLPRVEELFEARKKPKGEAVVTEIGGVVEVLRGTVGSDAPRVVRVTNIQALQDTYQIPGNWSLKVKDGQELAEGDLIGSRGKARIVAAHDGVVTLEGRTVTVGYGVSEVEEYEIPSSARLLVVDGQEVKPGDNLTEGSLNPHRILRIRGREACELYLITEMQQVYRSQGQNINDKHFEVILRKMLSRVQIVRPGDTDLLPDELMDRLKFQQINERLLAEGKQPAAAVPVLLGITKASLSTESFLSASSFQHTIKVLAGAAIEGKEDRLIGLKENVIIGKLIPAGSGFWAYHRREKQQAGEAGETQEEAGEEEAPAERLPDGEQPVEQESEQEAEPVLAAATSKAA